MVVWPESSLWPIDTTEAIREAQRMDNVEAVLWARLAKTNELTQETAELVEEVPKLWAFADRHTNEVVAFFDRNFSDDTMAYV